MYVLCFDAPCRAHLIWIKWWMEDNIIIIKHNTHYGNMSYQVSKGGIKDYEIVWPMINILQGISFTVVIR